MQRDICKHCMHTQLCTLTHQISLLHGRSVEGLKDAVSLKRALAGCVLARSHPWQWGGGSRGRVACLAESLSEESFDDEAMPPHHFFDLSLLLYCQGCCISLSLDASLRPPLALPKLVGGPGLGGLLFFSFLWMRRIGWKHCPSPSPKL